jgi:hypothetical protein
MKNNDATPLSDAPVDATSKGNSSRQVVRDAHVGLYLITRFVAVWSTLTMILTFFSESLLNTIRMNKMIADNGSAWVRNNPLIEQIYKFYPDGNTAVTLITSDLVYMYIFTVAVFTLMRFTYHHTLHNNNIEPSVGGLSWEKLKNQSLLVRLCWFFSPNAGVHKKFFVLWLGYVVLFFATFGIASLFGVSVYLSPQLKVVLFGGGTIVAFGLLEDMRFFQKIPPKEAVISSLLALLEGRWKKDLPGTIKRISAIASETDQTNRGDTIEIMTAILDALKAQEAKEAEKNSQISEG